MTRLTGLNSGLDVDALVKASMTTYQSKIDTETQNKKVLEYQQEQYKKIISDSANFYDKYFDILKTGNLISTNSYQSVSFKSGDDTKVTAKGFAGADVSDYKVTVTQIASKATASFDKSTLTGTDKSKIYVRVGNKPVSVDIVNTGDYEKDMKTTVNNLNAKLNKEGINISAKYSEFSKGIVLESGTMGESTIFEAGIGSSETYTEYKGTNSKGIITKGTEIYEFDNPSNILTVDNVQFTFKSITNGSIETSALEDKGPYIYEDEKGNSVEKSVNGSKSTIIITSKDGKTKTTINIEGDKKIQTTEAEGRTKRQSVSLLNDKGEWIQITNAGGSMEHLVYDEIYEPKSYKTSDGYSVSISGDGSKTITSEDGKTVTKIDSKGDIKTETFGEVTLSGNTDVSNLKETIISFVNDYNTLLSSINTKIYETRDKDYMPLSDEQKKEMTDDQIEKWETKAQTGLIRKDMDLERITSAMKSAMSTVISGSGLTLESIGIKPVANYAEKNGMFTIDEATLTKALEENAGNIKDLFTRAVSTDDKKGGIFTQLAATLKSEFKSSTASLSKKAGIDGTSSQYSNALTKSIAKKKTLIQELNNKFSVKETALYKKYSALETALEKLNSQQASLSSMLGTS